MSSSPAILERAPALSPSEFEKISNLAYQHCGVDLRKNKHALVEARIGKKLRELGISSFQLYFEHVQADTTGHALTSMVDVLTTNHTSFFREPRHFDLLAKTIFPTLQHQSQIHLWSAACSSGEEPYTIAMSLLETSREQALRKVRILASDISTRVLEKARKAIYPADPCSAIPAPLLQRYMLKGHNAAADTFRFKPEVRNLVEFLHLNLMNPLPQDYRCSVIFCRNIMIYFDQPTQQNLVHRLTQHLDDGGYLFIGHSESLNSIKHSLDYVAPATYRKPARGLGRCS